MEQVFLSWSGEKSNKFANLIKTLVPDVLQATSVFISTDIDKGNSWLIDITTALRSSKFGIVCITSDNVNNPWLLFEAGALCNRFESAEVCTVLFGIEPSNVPQPLGMFQATKFDKVDFLKLARTINSKLAQPIDEERLEKAFDRCWGEFEAACNAILQEPAELKDNKKAARKDREVLDEVLDIVRSLRNSAPSQSLDEFFSRNDFAANKNAVVSPSRAGATKAIIDALASRENAYWRINDSLDGVVRDHLGDFVDASDLKILADWLGKANVPYSTILKMLREDDPSRYEERLLKIMAAQEVRAMRKNKKN